MRVNEHKTIEDLWVRDVDCRTSLCRVELSHDDAEALRQALPQFALQVAGDLPGMAVQPFADDEQPVVVYLSRGDLPFNPRPVPFESPAKP
jgi:hypothetical protein